MKNFFKLLSLLVAVVLLFSIVACGEDDFETSLYTSETGYIDGFNFHSFSEFSEFYSDFRKYNKITTISFDLDEFNADGKYKLTYSFYCYPFKQDDGMPTWKGRFSQGQFVLWCYGDSDDFVITCRNLSFENYAVKKRELTFKRRPNYSFDDDSEYRYSIYLNEIELVSIDIKVASKNADDAEELVQTLKQNLVVLR